MTGESINFSELLEKARTYVSMEEKMNFINYAAERCFDKMAVHAEDGGRELPMPPYYKDNTELKSRYLLGAFIRLYLGLDYATEGDDEWLMTREEYDRLGAMHIFNNFNRLKTAGGDTYRKVCDLLNDWKDTEKRFNTEVYNLLQVMNDPCTRLFAMVGMVTAPQAMARATSELQDMQKEIEAVAKRRKESK